MTKQVKLTNQAKNTMKNDIETYSVKLMGCQWREVLINLPASERDMLYCKLAKVGAFDNGQKMNDPACLSTEAIEKIIN